MSDQINSADFPESDVANNSEALTLQRGGEELMLEKTLYRFTIRPNANFPQEKLSQIPGGVWRRSIPQAKLELYTVFPNQLDAVMSQLRDDEQVDFVSHVYTLENNPGTFVYLSDQITIQFATWVDNNKINTIASTLNLVQDQPVVGIPNTFVFLVSKQATQNPIKITNQLQKLSEVLAAEPNILIQQEPHYKPKDSLYSQQWYLNHNSGNQLIAGSHISVEQAWDTTRGLRSIILAVVDDSFDLKHPDFQGTGKIVAPRDLKENDLFLLVLIIFY